MASRGKQAGRVTRARARRGHEGTGTTRDYNDPQRRAARMGRMGPFLSPLLAATIDDTQRATTKANAPRGENLGVRNSKSCGVQVRRQCPASFGIHCNGVPRRIKIGSLYIHCILHYAICAIHDMIQMVTESKQRFACSGVIHSKTPSLS